MTALTVRLHLSCSKFFIPHLGVDFGRSDVQPPDFWGGGATDPAAAATTLVIPKMTAFGDRAPMWLGSTASLRRAGRVDNRVGNVRNGDSALFDGILIGA